jgi:hypothetical protein
MSDDTEQGDLGHDVEIPPFVTIFVNTREQKVKGPAVTYERVVQFYDGPRIEGPDVEYTVTYRRGPAQNPEGTLYAHQSVAIINGMIFNVTPTDKS